MKLHLVPTRRSLSMLAVLPLLTAALISQSPTTAGSAQATPQVVAASNQINTDDADAVRAAYRRLWQPATGARVAGSGSTSSCSAGSSTDTEQAATRNAINFARGLVGENAIAFSDDYNRAASASALIMAANGRLSHDPPSSWRCWTHTGDVAASHSNLLLNSSPPTAARLVQLYLSDPGSTNTAAGHRRWLLRPEATRMGSGSVNGSDWFANAIYVLSQAYDNKGAAAQRFYAWPSAGYFPGQLEPGGRWSLSSSSGAGFANATVSVTGPDGRWVPVVKRQVVSGYADSTLVWDFKNPPATVTSRDPRRYKVVVDGIERASQSRYSYYVRIFDPMS